MNLIKSIITSSAAVVLALGFGSCSEEKLGPTIFPDVDTEADKNSHTYKFDTWLNRNFRDVYNMNIYYKMRDVEADMNYNLVPASLSRATDLSLLIKYLWFDAYGELVGEEFLKQYGPRIIHLIGSPAYNPSAGTEILGLAEGGLKVSLFKVNELDLNDVNALNEYYFRTMHHEFGHILHQTKTYPSEFNLISNGLYDTSSWQTKNGGMMTSQGFITPYASAENREDFAETIANFITRTDEQLGMLMWCSAQGWSTGKDDEEEEDKDDDPYYCYYYFRNDADRKAQKRTYVLNFVDRPTVGGTVDMRVGVMQDGKFMADSTSVQKWVADLDSSLRVSQRNVESKSAYGKNYADLTTGEKSAIDRIVDEMQFVFPVPDEDGIDGRAIILQKQNIVRNWFKDTWKLDYDGLRAIVQERQRTMLDGLDELRKEVEAIN